MNSRFGFWIRFKKVSSQLKLGILMDLFGSSFITFKEIHSCSLFHCLGFYDLES